MPTMRRTTFSLGSAEAGQRFIDGPAREPEAPEVLAQPVRTDAPHILFDRHELARETRVVHQPDLLELAHEPRANRVAQVHRAQRIVDLALRARAQGQHAHRFVTPARVLVDAVEVQNILVGQLLPDGEHFRCFLTNGKKTPPAESNFDPVAGARFSLGDDLGHLRPRPHRSRFLTRAGAQSITIIRPGDGRNVGRSDDTRRTRFALRRFARFGLVGDAVMRQHLRRNLGGDRRVFPEEAARRFLALAETFLGIAEPRAALLDDVDAGGDVDHVALERDALAVEDVELAGLERRRDLVLHDLHLGARTRDVFAFLDGTDAADVETHRRIELERIAARGRFRRTEHDTDLHADLVGEDQTRLGPR